MVEFPHQLHDCSQAEACFQQLALLCACVTTYRVKQPDRQDFWKWRNEANFKIPYWPWPDENWGKQRRVAGNFSTMHFQHQYKHWQLPMPYPARCIGDRTWHQRLALFDIDMFNPLNAELNPVCHLLALLGAHHILHVSRVRVKTAATTDWL